MSDISETTESQKSKSVSDREHRLERLCRWMALTFAGNEPVFAAVNPLTGEPMHYSMELAMTWAELFGETDPTPGYWFRCDHCGTFQINSVPDRQLEMLDDLLT